MRTAALHSEMKKTRTWTRYGETRRKTKTTTKNTYFNRDILLCVKNPTGNWHSKKLENQFPTYQHPHIISYFLWAIERVNWTHLSIQQFILNKMKWNEMKNQNNKMYEIEMKSGWEQNGTEEDGWAESDGEINEAHTNITNEPQAYALLLCFYCAY